MGGWAKVVKKGPNCLKATATTGASRSGSKCRNALVKTVLRVSIRHKQDNVTIESAHALRTHHASSSQALTNSGTYKKGINRQSRLFNLIVVQFFGVVRRLLSDMCPWMRHNPWTALLISAPKKIVEFENWRNHLSSRGALGDQKLSGQECVFILLLTIIFSVTNEFTTYARSIKKWTHASRTLLYWLVQSSDILGSNRFSVMASPTTIAILAIN